MSTKIPVSVPDIGDFDEVEVIEILVAVGDVVEIEDPLVTLESDKATMDIPAPQAGEIVEISVSLGDKVAEGSVIVVITASENAAPDSSEAENTSEQTNQERNKAETPAEESPAAQAAPGSQATTIRQVVVPDIGDFDSVDVIEILVQPGDVVALEDPLITLESDKATMDIPAPGPGTVEEIMVAIGDKVAEGHVILLLTAAAEAVSVEKKDTPAPSATAVKPPATGSTGPTADSSIKPVPASTAGSRSKAYASPSIRKFARELGVELGLVSGSGRKGRIVKSDIQAFVKTAMSAGASSASAGLGSFKAPTIDFSKFGPIETQSLSKIKRLTGQNLHRSWIDAPHVTQFDEADITDLEAFRKSQAGAAKEQDVKLTMLAFLIKGVVRGLQKFPDFNASLAPDGESLIVKGYFNVGIAVNTQHGLVVPVLRDADKKGLFELAGELGVLGEKARTRKLSPADKQGGCFTISSLGGVGGTAFTPIINVPEVAILGVSRSAIKPVFIDNEFVPRLMLPLALSYDHRVIDGVAGAQFTSHLGAVLGDIRELLL